MLVSLAAMAMLGGCGGGGGGSSTASAPADTATATTTPVSPADNPGTATAAPADSGSTAAAPTAKTVNLSWNASTDAGGAPLADLAGYKVYYGKAPGSYSKVVTVDNGTSAAINLDDTGTYYFVVTVFDTAGNESGYSEEVSKTVS